MNLHIAGIYIDYKEVIYKLKSIRDFDNYNYTNFLPTLSTLFFTRDLQPASGI